MFPKISGKISIGVLYPLLKGQNTPYLTGDTGRGEACQRISVGVHGGKS